MRQAPPQKPEGMPDLSILDEALKKAVREAVLKHAKLGQPVSTWRDGKVVWLQPAEVFALFQEPANETGKPTP
jgi:hypothetical protein